ncbi:hypothetical protein BDW42DRAFT_169636 [Aspergillus taichungensis]|uniref:Uncharacterized protein n=1 Tax=Aspergillus taichungensis TaxID=482145 RepID=A0A2J5HV06_9EURO|nr:hypothetical protein BDW42DRAFT_169636 [Aspergillus taichungensis]
MILIPPWAGLGWLCKSPFETSLAVRCQVCMLLFVSSTGVALFPLSIYFGLQRDRVCPRTPMADPIPLCCHARFEIQCLKCP